MSGTLLKIEDVAACLPAFYSLSHFTKQVQSLSQSHDLVH